MTNRPYTLDDLRAMMTPGQLRLADERVRLLPTTSLVTVPEICIAADVDDATVRAWIDERELDALDTGARAKQYWKVSRSSIVLLLHKRVLGVRTPVERTLKGQETFPFIKPVPK